LNRLKKRYDPLKDEQLIFELWQKEKTYAFDKNSGKPIYSVDTPPPYANAPWHMGGAIHYSGIDMIARYKRMTGHEVLFPMCLDRNGLPVEVQTEKEFKISMHDIPREEFLDKCRIILDRVGDEILNVCKFLGFSNYSFEWDEIYKTDHPQYRALTQSTFIKLFREGLVYEDDRPNNYCTRCKTTIADNEIDYKPGTHILYDIAFKVKETGEELIIATSRPELIPAIGVVIFNPKDERYKHLEGKTAIAPYFNVEVPIRSHHYAKMDFGTGILMVCAYGDIGDVQIFREFQLEPRTVIGTDGKINENVPEFQGLKVKEARKQIADKLRELGFIKSETDVPHNFPICSRCDNPVEFLAMPEYYLKQTDYIDTLRSYADKLTFYPEFMKQIWLDWLDRVSIDWPISRRRYYGTEIPIWYCKSCGKPCLPEPGPYYQPWKDDPPFDKCEHCGESKGFIGDTRTFDTWMDSSISEIYIQMYPYNKKDLELFEKLNSRPYICDMRPQGKDIVRTWLHYTMLRALQLYNKPAFKETWISGHVVDNKGEKMSKSKGNIVKPEKMIAKYGGDALRLFGASEASHGSDIRFSEQKLQGIAKFINKFYNIAKFVSGFPSAEDMDENSLTPTDVWILSELRLAIEDALQGYEIFDFHKPARALRKFTWELFASNYLEIVKGRAYNRNNEFTELEQKSAHYTLHKVLDILLKAFAPIIPFVTDFIYRELYEKTVHTESMPQPDDVIRESRFTESTELILKLNSIIWKQKKDLGLSLKTPIKRAFIPQELNDFSADLKAMHSIETLINDSSSFGQNSKKIVLDEDKNQFIYLEF